MYLTQNDLPSFLDNMTEWVNVACVVEAKLASSIVVSIGTTTKRA